MAWQGLSEWLDFFMRDVLAPETLDARATNLRKQYFIHGPFFFTSANRFLQPGQLCHKVRPSAATRSRSI